MTAQPSEKYLAFFGATGGCAGYCLAAALNAGHKCTALARTPSKLTASLQAKNVASEILTANLTIIEGNVKDLAAVKRTLAPNGRLVDVVISGIGGVPKLEWSLIRPVGMYDGNICRDAIAIITQAARESEGHGQKKPFIINVSTTGIPAPGCPRDVPFLYIALYHWLLARPHEDKKVVEAGLRAEMQKEEGLRAFSGFVIVKPTLLMDGETLGLEKVRAGGEKNPALGYTIKRQEVGEWMFEKLVKPTSVPSEWRNSSVCLTS